MIKNLNHHKDWNLVHEGRKPLHTNKQFRKGQSNNRLTCTFKYNPQTNMKQNSKYKKTNS